MYNTTSVLSKPANGSAIAANPSDHESSVTTDKLSIKISARVGLCNRKKRTSEHSFSHHSVARYKRFIASCLSWVLLLSLGTVIVLWIIALIIDGPDDMQSCVVVWPFFTGVLVVAFFYILLRCFAYHHSEKHYEERRNTTIESSSVSWEQQDWEQPDEYFVLYQQHICITLLYGALLLSLVCIMIASVSQFFSIGYDCYLDFKNAREEVMLGYQILAYMSVVVLSIMGCLLTCVMFGILVSCCTPDRHTATV